MSDTRTLKEMINSAAAFVTGVSADDEVRSLTISGMNAGIGILNSRNWKKIFGVWTLDFVADTSKYTVPTDFKEPIVLLRLNSSGDRDGRIPYKPHRTFYVEHSCATQSGDCCVYTFDYNGRAIEFDLKASTSFVATYPQAQARYHRRVAVLANDEDKTDLEPEFNDWLILRGAARLARIRSRSKLRGILEEENELWQWLRTSDNSLVTDDA